MQRISLRLVTLTVGMVVLGLLAIARPAQARFDVSVCQDVEPGEQINESCMALMESFPEPRVLPVQQDSLTLNNYSFWRVENTQPPVYSSPGGQVTRNMPNGFTFVRVIDTSVDGWVQIETGEWMQRQHVEYNQASRFSGVRLLDGLENRFAWVLGNLYTSRMPGGPQDTENGRLLRRYDRVNIFNTVTGEDGWKWYMVGPNQWIEQRMVGIAQKVEKPEDVEGRWVAIDLYEQVLVAYEGETPVFATLVATGVPGWDTEEGVHKVWARLERDGMSGATGAPEAWDLQSVPWVQYFDESVSLHGTYWHDNFGYRQSKGCVNMSISDAHYVFDWMAETDVTNAEGEPVNHVYVYASGEYRSSGAATK